MKICMVSSKFQFMGLILMQQNEMKTQISILEINTKFVHQIGQDQINQLTK